MMLYFLVGLAFLSICAFWQMYDSIVPLILTKTFHMNETFSGAIMAADNILALFLLPFTVAGLAVLPLIYRPLILLRFDAAVARSFGLSYRKQFSLVLLVSCALAASA